MGQPDALTVVVSAVPGVAHVDVVLQVSMTDSHAYVSQGANAKLL